MSSFKYAPLKVLHFDIDTAALNKLDNFNLACLSVELIPVVQLFDALNKSEESKVFIRWTFRISDNTGKQFGSFISEQDFFAKYTGQDETYETLKNLLSNSHFFAEQKFEKLVKEHGSNRGITFPIYNFSEFTINDLVGMLKEDTK